MRQAELSADDLGLLTHARQYGREEDRRIAERQQKTKTEVENQRGVVREARRQYELLERLKEAQFRQWSYEFNREQETQIGELTIARWRRDRSEF
jgi:HD superfamily phosphohydrolase